MSIKTTILLTLLGTALSACGAPQQNKPDGAETVEQRPSSSTPTYRTVERAASTEKEQPELPFDAFDPFVDSAVSAATRAKLAADYRVELDENTTAFVGDFATAPGDELAMISAAGELVIVAADGGVHAKRAVGVLDTETPPRTAQLIDHRLDLVLVWRESASGPRQLSVFRVIGEAIAEVFRADLETSEVHFVHRGEERAILVVSEAGSDVFRWNRWEGMFRVPRPAPTAPRG